MADSRKAVVLLSGGLDSTTVVAVARRAGFDIYALTVHYGQRHHGELDAARRVAQAFDVVEHAIIDVDLGRFGGSALTGTIDVPKHDSDADIDPGIPATYVPARNTVLLSVALAWAETLKANDIFIGVNAVDYSGYPDCRPDFIEAFERLANLATKAGSEGARIAIRAPLIDMTKGQIIQRGLEVGVDYSITSSCYDPAPTGAACGACDACLLRKKGFEEAGVVDPTRYSTHESA